MIPARIGVLVPAGNPTVEPEFYRMAPTGVTIHFARLDSGAGAPGTPEAMERRTLGYLDALPDAVRALAHVRPAVIVLAHTGVSYLNGAAGEAALAARLSKLGGTRATTAAGAVGAGLRQLGVKRLAWPAVPSGPRRASTSSATIGSPTWPTSTRRPRSARTRSGAPPMWRRPRRS